MNRSLPAAHNIMHYSFGKSWLVLVFAFMVFRADGAVGDLRWSFAAGDAITSSPAVDSEGNLYFGSIDKKVYSLTSDGQLRWTRETGDWVESSPALSMDESVLYVGSWDDNLYALDTNTGNTLWTFATESLVFSSPAVAEDGTIYFGSSDSFFYALNPDGSLKWNAVIGSEIDSSPAIDGAGNVYFGTLDGDVCAFNAAGDELWSILLPDDPLTEDNSKAVIASPMLSGDGRLYVGSGNAYLYAIDTGDGSIVWKYRAEDVVDVSPVMGVDKNILFSSRDGYLYSLNNDGVLAWKVLAGIDYYSSPIVDAIGRIYICASTGVNENALTAFSSAGSEIWTRPLPDFVDSSPTILEDGTICFGANDGVFYAIVGEAGLSRASAWPRFRRNHSQRSSLLGYVAPQAGLERIKNISLRSSPKGGGEDIFSGFVVAGTGQKSLLLRFVGPELMDFGLSGALLDPKMDLYRNVNGVNELIASADDWSTPGDLSGILAATENVGAFPLDAGSKDASTVASLGAGIYSVVASSADGEAGVGLFELYDADAESTSAGLVNFSMRGVVGVGEEVLILGFVVDGNLPRRFLIRSVGAGLGVAPFNVEGVAPDTQVQLLRGQQVYASNDDWDTGGEKDDLESAFAQVGAFALQPGDSALSVWLEPGIYSAVVSSKTGETGIALVEFYQLGDN